jgi:hypothetical protein
MNLSDRLGVNGRRSVCTQADVTKLWRDLLADTGCSRPQFACVCIGESGRVVPDAIELDGLPLVPDQTLLDEIAVRVHSAMTRVPRGTAALLWSRPGRGPLRPSDRAWLHGLAEALRTQHVATWPAHFANDAYMRIVDVDDLAA